MFRLPDGWGTPEVFEDVVVAAGMRLRRTGVAVRAPTGEEIVGSAAARGEPTKKRAWYELAERVCIIDAIRSRRRRLPTFDAKGERLDSVARSDAFPTSDAPNRWVPARSSGVALHRDWPTACARAYAELAERDRVLRAWLGEVVPVEIAIADRRLAAAKRYEWRAFSLPGADDGFAANIAVVTVVGFPRRDDEPLALGFGARPSIEDARSAATNEALQQLAFLWGEPVADGPSSAIPSPALHLDTYQAPKNRVRLRRWLEHGHRIYAVRRSKKSNADAEVRFLDLSGSWLARGVRVAKAVSDAALPLGFGALPALRRLPKDLRIHPIP